MHFLDIKPLLNRLKHTFKLACSSYVLPTPALEVHPGRPRAKSEVRRRSDPGPDNALPQLQGKAPSFLNKVTGYSKKGD